MYCSRFAGIPFTGRGLDRPGPNGIVDRVLANVGLAVAYSLQFNVFMRHLKSILLTAVVALALPVLAQEQTTVVKVNPAGWFAGQWQMGLEKKISNRVTAQIMPGYFYRTGKIRQYEQLILIPTWPEVGRYEVSGSVVTGEVRYYLAATAPDGFYLSPFARFRSLTTTVTEDEVRSIRCDAWTKGLVVGFQKVPNRTITYDVFLGLHHRTWEEMVVFGREFLDYQDPTGENVGLRFGFSIGHPF